jgi:hypothetical protein
MAAPMMYDLVAGSPEVTLPATITASQLSFDITSGSGLVPPMLITLCDRTRFETCLATGYTGSTVTVAARARAGTARAWPGGTVVMVGWTAEHYTALKSNLIRARAGSRLFLASAVGAM